MQQRAEGHQLVDAPVRRVTVLEDRAQVQRSARLSLKAGRHLLEVERVTPLAVDRSLRGGLDGPSGRLVDLGLRRTSTVAATRPWLQQELELRREQFRREMLTHQNELELAQGERGRLRQVRGFVLQHICQQAGRGVERSEEWRRDLAQVEQELRLTMEREEGSRQAVEDVQQRMDRLGERLSAALTPTVCYWATLRAVVDVESAGEYEVSWEYLVPCALWRPAHQAELQGEMLCWSLLGTVWQNTGEDWREVELRLSTERPTLGAELPLLEEDLLKLRPKSDEEKRTIEVSSREEEIEAISPGMDAEARVGVVPGVDDGGEVRVFELARSVSIPSDGRAHLVTLDSFESETRLDRVCFPELAESVLLRSQQRNSAAKPLLAGPVRLIQNGGFTGRTQIPFVAPGEPFALGWGSQDELQVVRRSGQSREEKTLTRRVCHNIWTKVYLSNTGATPRQVTVMERIPVSEVEQVQITLSKETTEGHRRTGDGHLVWELSLEAGTQREIHLQYQVDTHRKVVWR